MFMSVLYLPQIKQYFTEPVSATRLHMYACVYKKNIQINIRKKYGVNDDMGLTALLFT